MRARSPAWTNSLKELARRSPVCWRLMSVPGVGPIVAVAFMAAIEDVGRFRRMRDIGVSRPGPQVVEAARAEGDEALAHKLAALLGRIWKDGTHFGVAAA